MSPLLFSSMALAVTPPEDNSFLGYLILTALGIWILLEATGRGVFFLNVSVDKEVKKDRSMREGRIVKAVASDYRRDLDPPERLIDTGTLQITSICVDDRYVYFSSGGSEALKAYDKTSQLIISKNCVNIGRNTLCNDEQMLYTFTSEKKVLILAKSDCAAHGEISDNRISKPLGVDNRHIYTGFQGYIIGVFDKATRSYIGAIGRHVSDIIAVCSDNEKVYSADSSFLQITDMLGNILGNVPAGGVICSLAIDDKYAYISLYDGRISIRDKTTGTHVREIAAGHGGLSSIAVDDKFIYYGSVKSGIRIFSKL